MAKTNKIFSKGLIQDSDKNVIQKVRYNREQLLSKETAKELNTYLNFGIFPTYAETFISYYDKDTGELIEAPPEKGSTNKSGIGTPGVRSLFNRAGAVMLGSYNGSYDVDITNGDDNNTHYWRITNNIPLMDSPKARQRIRKSSGCSIKELVNDSAAGLMGQETYAYSDFMYCKHLGKVSNNYLVTLRRFPLPVDDYIGAKGETASKREATSAKQASCIGCMVTWMGVSGNDLANMLKYSYKMPFREQDAEWQDGNQSADTNLTVLNGIFSAFDSNYQKQYLAGYSGIAANTAFEAFGIKLGNPPYANNLGFRDKNKVYGPIDAIKSTYIRDGKGITFDQKISVVFEYELRSYNGINPKQAMLDLISNILNVTYTTGSFWGGGIKGYGAQQSNIFANLNIFKCKGGFTDFVDAFSKDLSNLTSNIKADIDENGGVLATAKKLLNSIGGMLIAGKLNQLGRPQKVMYHSLLSPAPIGFWHLTIGNPKRPIMSIGNMIITNCTIEHNGPLGLDDFPTGLKVTVELDRGKPRDLRDIEKLYMQGTDRIYSSMTDKVYDMYKNAELYKASRTNKTAYNPVVDTATIEFDSGDKTAATITMSALRAAGSTLKKYCGTDDTYSIFVAAAEQEYGSGKKRPIEKTGGGTSGGGSSNDDFDGTIKRSGK
jgi:hypothetical protein